MKTVKALIFDMDGVITETSENHYLAWKSLAGTLGFDFERAFNEKLKGVSRRDSLELILQAAGKATAYSEAEKIRLMDEKNALYLASIQGFTRENLLPGVAAFLGEIKGEGMKVAIASASQSAPLLVQKLGIEAWVDHIVDPAGLPGKPDPAIFLSAMDHFGLTPEECLGVEDAVAGIAAIKAAGMFALGIGDRTVLTRADLVIENFESITLKGLLEVAHGKNH